MTSVEVRQVKSDDIFVVELLENPSAGYLWELVSKDEFEIRSISTKMDNSKDFEDLVGAPVVKIFFLQAKAPGEFDLRFSKKRPWEKHSPPVDTYHELIVVSE